MADKFIPAAGFAPAPLKFRSKKWYISLRFKLTFFVLLTIGSIMALATWLTYQQQQRALRNEVVQRGATIARSLASSAAETVLNDLVCAALIHETMPDARAAVLPSLSFESILFSLINDVYEYAQVVPAGRILRNAGVVEVLMVDTNNVIVAHNDIRKVSIKYRPPPGVKAYQGEDILVQPYTPKSGEKRFDIAVPILVNRLGTKGGKYIGVVHLRMSQEWVDVTVKQAAYKLLIVMGVILLIGLMAAMVLANVMTRPIKYLVKGVLAIASGDFNQKIKVGSNDELGELTSAFNQMAVSLKEKELIKGAFSTYVSSQVMEEVLKDPGRMALGGARKRATMMFADIRGFTAMSETMEPEQVVTIINAYLSLQTEIVLSHGGVLDKFVGDCSMAVYGIPLPREDDALRAVRAAVEIQKEVDALNHRRRKSGERTVTVGIGINTGEVVSGNMGSSRKMDYTVIGDAVNLAARLESVAEGGSILISENTYQEVKPWVQAERLSPLMVKGKKEKVFVYSVQSMKAGAATNEPDGGSVHG